MNNKIKVVVLLPFFGVTKLYVKFRRENGVKFRTPTMSSSKRLYKLVGHNKPELSMEGWIVYRTGISEFPRIEKNIKCGFQPNL